VLLLTELRIAASHFHYDKLSGAVTEWLEDFFQYFFQNHGTPCILISYKAPAPVKMESAENNTRHQLLLQSLEAAILDNFDRDNVSSPKHGNNRMSPNRSCLSQDINEEIEIPESWIGEFARVKL
jgi:hypothetical protein